MTHNDPRRLEPIGDSTPDDGDFAEEHRDTTFADEVPGGPEHAEEPESPEGRAGMD